MIDLFSDLDNTLIYSCRAKLCGEKVLAERLDGIEQSCMTVRTLKFLQSVSSLRLIPVTTRSKEQFLRITLFQTQLPCRYALVCNGGELLVDGESDPQWFAETRELTGPAMDALREGTALMESMLGPGKEVRTPSGLMACAVFEDPAEVVEKLRAKINTPVLSILRVNRKVYCIPSVMHKGTALERFKARYQTGTIVTAGDSIFDIPLLEAGDHAITNRKLAAFVHNPNTIAIEDDLILSDEICTAIANISP